MNEDTFVIDTHALLWYLGKSERLSVRVREILDAADTEQSTVLVPTIVLAEALTLIEKRKVSVTLEELDASVRDTTRFTVVPLDNIVYHAMIPLAGLELHDRAIAATCKLFDCPLLARDRDLAKAVTTIW